MKKVILILALVVSFGEAKSMCTYYLKNGTKNIEMAKVQDTQDMKNFYLKMAVESDINAKYECPAVYKKRIEKLIKDISGEIK